MIVFDNLSKNYGQKRALQGLNLQIENGEIFGLIGHNGAGKSTTIKSLVSIIRPTEGEIFIDGEALSSHRDAIKQRIGYVPDSPDMFLALTPDFYWHFIGRIYGIAPEILTTRIAELCDLFDLHPDPGETISAFSHGMRQKTFVIGALLSSPDVWVLDEPLTGLDPQSAYNLKRMMRHHADTGHTVLFSTHVLAVAEEVCDRIGILRRGQLIFSGTMDELRAEHPGDSLEDIYLKLVASAEEGAPA